MRKVEVSCLFKLQFTQNIVTNFHIGNGVWIEKIVGSDWIRKVKEYCPLLAAKEEMDWGAYRYTHRLYAIAEGTTDIDNQQVQAIKQLILQAIVLSRIVRPTPIALHGAWVFGTYSEAAIIFSEQIEAGFYGRAYVGEPRRLAISDPLLTIENNDAQQIAELWPAFHNFHVNEPQFRRIVRALKYFDAAYHIGYLDFSHIIFHAALESLICTKQPGKNKQEVTKRLPQIVPSISQTEAKNIYDLCCDLKHSAAPLFLSSGLDGPVSQEDADRVQATSLLREALGAIFRRAIKEPSVAEALCDKTKLRKAYPI